MKGYNRVLFSLLRNVRTYNRLKADESKRETSNRLGVSSVLSSIFGIAFAVLSIWAVSALIENFNNTDTLQTLLIIVGLFILFVIFVGVFLQLIVSGILCAVLQMRLNKKPIGVISLILWILMIVAAVIITVLIL